MPVIQWVGEEALEDDPKLPGLGSWVVLFPEI